MADIEKIESVRDYLHDGFQLEADTDFATITDEELHRLAIHLIDKYVREKDSHPVLLAAYDCLANPEMADDDYSLYGEDKGYTDCGYPLRREMELYNIIAQDAYDICHGRLNHIPLAANNVKGDFSIDNDDLCDFILHGGHDALSLQLALSLANEMLEENVGINGVYQDTLSSLRGQVCELKDTNEKLQESTEDVMNKIYQMYKHEQIGQKLGFEGWQLGTYDAIVGWFYEPFNPRIVEMAQDVNEYIENLTTSKLDILPKDETTLIRMLRDKLRQLADKHEVTLHEEMLTFNYIFSNNTQMLPVVANADLFDEE